MAQPGSALALGARGPRFESARPDQSSSVPANPAMPMGGASDVPEAQRARGETMVPLGESKPKGGRRSPDPSSLARALGLWPAGERRCRPSNLHSDALHGPADFVHLSFFHQAVGNSSVMVGGDSAMVASVLGVFHRVAQLRGGLGNPLGHLG